MPMHLLRLLRTLAHALACVCVCVWCVSSAVFPGCRMGFRTMRFMFSTKHECDRAHTKCRMPRVSTLFHRLFDLCLPSCIYDSFALTRSTFLPTHVCMLWDLTFGRTRAFATQTWSRIVTAAALPYCLCALAQSLPPCRPRNKARSRIPASLASFSKALLLASAMDHMSTPTPPWQ